MLLMLAGAALAVAGAPVLVLVLYLGSTLVGESVKPAGELPVVPATPTEQPVEPVEEAPAVEVDAPPTEVSPAPVPPPRVSPAPRAAPRVRPPPAPVVPEPDPVPEPVGLVTVKILSVPPTALVHVDGQESGRTPLKIQLAPGRYAVSLTSGSQRAEYVLQVGEGSNKWCYDFAAAHNRPGGC